MSIIDSASLIPHGLLCFAEARYLMILLRRNGLPNIQKFHLNTPRCPSTGSGCFEGVPSEVEALAAGSPFIHKPPQTNHFPTIIHGTGAPAEEPDIRIS